LKKRDTTKTGRCISELPILNKGTVTIQNGIQLDVYGRAEGGTTDPSIKQESGSMSIEGGSLVWTQHGMTVTGGDLIVKPMLAGIQSLWSTIVGNFAFGGTGAVKFENVATAFGGLRVDGDVTWTSGTYQPRVNATSPNGRDQWWSTGTFTVGATAVIDPQFLNAPANLADIPERSWAILIGQAGIIGSTDGHLPVPRQALFDVLEGTMGMMKTWSFHRKGS